MGIRVGFRAEVVEVVEGDAKVVKLPRREKPGVTLLSAASPYYFTRAERLLLQPDPASGHPYSLAKSTGLDELFMGFLLGGVRIG